MSARNNENKKDVIKELENKISPVLVVNNSSLKPYIELFEYYPENVYQQSLGSLVGFFEVKEYSKDSAYIVNFLTSTLKKEYYINPKRPVSDSLDSALHKVNLALSELVKQGNVEWLGNLNAAICVLEKNSVHFSVSGNAKIFLFRKGMLSNISEGLASDSVEPHPLKTFVNVSSGRLEENDRMLITSEDIFHIFSITEIKKNFQRFEGGKFVQFIKTALSNQLEMIASIIIETKGAKALNEVKMPNQRKKSLAALNAFSEKTFSDAKQKTPASKKISDLEEPYEETSEYIDEKTGHIYVQGNPEELDKDKPANIHWEIAKEKMFSALYSIKNGFRRKIAFYLKERKKKKELRRIEKEKQAKIAAEEKIRQQERKAAEESLRLEEEKIRAEQEAKLREEQEQAKKAEELKLLEEQRQKEIENEKQQEIQEMPEKEQMIETENPEFSEPEQIETPTPAESADKLSFKEKLERAMRHYQQESTENVGNELSIEPEFENEPETKKINWKEKMLAVLAKTKERMSASFFQFLEKTKSIVQKIKQTKSEKEPAYAEWTEIEEEKISFIPHLKEKFLSLNTKQKAGSIAALVIIFIVPIFIARFLNKTEPQPIAETPIAPVITQSELLANEKNIELDPDVQIIAQQNNIAGTVVTSKGLAAVMKNKIMMMGNGNEEQKEYAFPENSGMVLRATYMQDLSLIFILTDKNKILSFSPVSAKFTEDSIEMPANPSKNLIGTYLTYLYVLDQQANQIYRYPRATGGFGAKTNWLKDTMSLAKVSDMTINDNIYLIQDNSVIKLFKGKKQEFNLENSKTPINFDKIFTTIDSQSLYVLDAKNSRLVQFNKENGEITKQYFNEELKYGASLSVDEQNKTAYVSTLNEILAISL
ncbi:MAG TPA: MAP7 domain-containing protein [Candidatus Moranbacteria bacterium]|nr:MAP7 domain-containing protein [Candidatus Moranbacteria bacterium]